MTNYLCAVSVRFPENYEIGLRAAVWGVEEKYRQKLADVKPGDKLVFLVGGEFRSIHRIESDAYLDRSTLWPPKDGDIFPHRVKIGAAMAVGAVAASSIFQKISFMIGTQNWGGTVQGPNGVFNRRLTDEDVRLIESLLKGEVTPRVEADPVVVKQSADRQTSLFRFYASDIEQRMEQLLPSLGLKLEKRDMRTPVGTIDFLCSDSKDGHKVIVMLKKGQAPNESLIEVLQRMSWIRQSQTTKTDVQGIIMTEEADQTLRDVVKEVPSVTIRYYRVTVELAA